eukprot:5216153-Pleurochrysis_carterae.AAC.1
MPTPADVISTYRAHLLTRAGDGPMVRGHKRVWVEGRPSGELVRGCADVGAAGRNRARALGYKAR